MQANSRKTVLRLTQMSMLAAISIALLYIIPLWSIIPSAPYLQYDTADIPVLVGTMIFGPWSGLMILTAVCLIQGLTISAGSGWVGIVMHLCASGAFVIVAGLVYRLGCKAKKELVGLICGLVLGGVVMTALMIPLNLVLTVKFNGAPFELVKDMIVPAIIPFNLIKSALNTTATVLLFVPLKKILTSAHLI